MLRHSRAMTRHHRKRIIRKKKQLIDAIWRNGWPEEVPVGKLAKHSTGHNSCQICNPPYKRYKFNWKREIAQQYDQ